MSRHRLLALLLPAALLAPLAASRAAAPEHHTGTLSVVWTCSPGAHPGGSPALLLREPGGGQLRLEDPDGHLPPVQEVNGQTVEIGGYRGATRDAQGQPVEALWVTGARPVGVRPLLTLPPTTGKRKVVTFLVRFKDTVDVTPFPPTRMGKLTGAAEPGLNHYFGQISDGQFQLDAKKVVGWLNLPKNREAYYNSGLPDAYAIMDDVVPLVSGSVSLDSYDGFHLVTNVPMHGSVAGIGGLVADPDLGTFKLLGFAFVWPIHNSGTEFAQSTFCHEVGHSLGWGHSLDARGYTYSSSWDVMGNSYGRAVADGVYEAEGTLAFNERFAGWIPASRQVTVAPGKGMKVKLQRLNQPAAADKLIALVPIKGTKRYYTVEARKQVGYDVAIPAEGVIIQSITPAPSAVFTMPKLVDATPADGPNDAGAVWLPGETFRDTKNNITIKVTGTTTNGYVVSIGNGKPAPPGAAIE